MTIHHDVALALAVLLVIGCLFGAKCDPQMFDKVINLSMAIAIATFAHAQGRNSAAAAQKHETKKGDAP